MNPLRYLRPAVFAALTSPAVELDGAVVPVKAFGEAEADVYVLLDPNQDTSNTTLRTRACRRWDCTLLVDVVTRNKNNRLSVEVADEVADLVSERLDNLRMELPSSLMVESATVETILGGGNLDGEQVDIHRYLRLRYTINHDLSATTDTYLGALGGPLPLLLT